MAELRIVGVPEWLTNTSKSGAVHEMMRVGDETQMEAWTRYWTFRRACVEGPPKATSAYTADQLEAQGMIGLYGRRG